MQGGCRFTCGIAAWGMQTSTCCLAVEARRHSSYLLPRCPDAAVVMPASSRTTGGGCRLTCRLAVDARRLSPSLRPGCSETNSSHLPPCRVFGAAVVLPAASPLRSLEATVAYLLPRPWMRGGIRETCLRGNNRRPLSSHLRPGCRCRLTRRSPCMRGGCRPTCDMDAAVVLPVASPWMRGGGRHTCGLKAIVVVPVALEFIEGGSRLLAALPWMQSRSRLTCRPGVDLRPQSFYLPPRRVCEAAVALPATWMPQSFYLSPRRGREAAVDLRKT